MANVIETGKDMVIDGSGVYMTAVSQTDMALKFAHDDVRTVDRCQTVHLDDKSASRKVRNEILFRQAIDRLTERTCSQFGL